MMVRVSATDRPERPLVVTKGAILSYRVFDVGAEIALERAEQALDAAPSQRAATVTREGAASSLAFATPPLQTALGMDRVHLPRTDVHLEASLHARIFDYGAVSIEFEFTIAPGKSLADLLPLCDELYDSPVLEDAGRKHLASLLDRLGEAVVSRHMWHGAETYTVIFVEALEGNPHASTVLHDPVLPKLLIGEPSSKSLSQEERRDMLKNAHSYLEDDLVVIDWNSAFVLEPSGSRDIPAILEFATSQLLEHRYYDSKLDAELGRIYDEFGRAPRGTFARIFRSPYAALARDVLRRLIEITEFTERVDNALKVIGDFYLARVYQSAVRRFRIPAWQASLNEKLALVRRAYELLKGDVEIQRSTLLEIVVVLLIAIEVVGAFWRH